MRRERRVLLGSWVRSALAVVALSWAGLPNGARAQERETEGLVEGRQEPADEEPADGEPADQEPDPEAERSAMARALFDDGVAHAHGARFELAADFFRRAHALRPAPGIAYNLASALVQLGRIVEAGELLQWVVRHEQTAEEMRSSALTTIARIRPRLARIRILLSGATADVVLTLDDRPIEYVIVGVSVPLDPGPHFVSVLRDERSVAQAEVTLREGEERRIELSVPDPSLPILDDPGLLAATTTGPIGPREDLSWLIWTSLGVGAAILAVVITSVVVVESQPGPASPIAGTTLPPFLEIE